MLIFLVQCLLETNFTPREKHLRPIQRLEFDVRCILLELALEYLEYSSMSLSSEIVETTFGKVQGGFGESRDGRSFSKFLGIPYAKAQRFKPPTDPDSWSDVRNATKNGNACPQIQPNLAKPSENSIFTSEDCLNLNVYTPKVPKLNQAKLMFPVIVWFHGGGGDTGKAEDYDPEYYMDADIVLVTFNARLGFLGYLNLGTQVASGNQRLKDEVAMLKWVQANIENFGGDPARVTLNGADSGGAEVGYHLISPRSSGLFARVITQDGFVTMPFMFIRNPMYQAKNFGMQSETTDAEFLKFGPSAEKGVACKSFIRENPYVSLRVGRIVNKVPWINVLSLNAGSFSYVYNILQKEDQRQKLNANLSNILPMYLDYEVIANDSNTVTQAIKEHYFGTEDINEKNARRFVDVISDRQFIIPSLRFSALYDQLAPHYALIVKYVPACSLSTIMEYNGEFEGGNFDLVSYQFPIRFFGYCGIDKNSSDYQVSKNTIQLLASFAENGKPTKTWGVNEEYPRYYSSEDLPLSFAIERDGQMHPHFLSEKYIIRFGFWAKLHEKELASEYENYTENEF
ncbi:unnamed protein product [Allacma fusca]|uniref:Carboxylesterase type B domain-containing protein n=1 Tax=Allacma fusca TaxID=39272 RepID=A0A8J2L9L9_9HEXA|nr:unnamed protein product [Allacma fusca]